jgi:protein tyrosine phosphatase (PTP) superfamily phosphohydrolase (DUF442 family)
MIAAAVLGACARRDAPAAAIPSVSDTVPRDYPGLHNAVAYHDGLVSGSVPEGDAGFDTLRAMGVKTIISVDGAEPDVERARARGIRYIHLPIGYDGFDEDRALQLARATRDALDEGPVYMHCHHGKHRSAAAAAVTAANLGLETPERGIERMKVSGTAPNYKGLYACAASARALDADVIDAVPADFPSAWKPTGFVKGMIEIDEAFEHLRTIEKAGWVTPADHPDLVPAAEAGRLVDLHRVLAESDYAKRRPTEFTAFMAEGTARAQALEDLLAAAGAPDVAQLGDRFALVAASCKACHAKYRD